MRKKIGTTVALALFLTGVAVLPLSAAQDAAKESESLAKSSDSYRVEFTIDEQDNGKKINSRSYSLLVRSETSGKWTDMKRLRVGSNVPVAVGANSTNGLQYMDIGMNIDCRLLPLGNGKVAIDTNWEYSSAENAQEREMGHPVIRHVSSSVDADVPLNKPTVVAEVDDVASTHRFVFEVKITKIAP